MVALAIISTVSCASEDREAALGISPLPSDERDVVVEGLGTKKYVAPTGGKGFCGTDVFSTYSGESVAHGLTSESELLPALIDAVEELGWPIEEYEHRWFGETRIVLFSASPNDQTKPLFVDAMEVVLVEDENGEQVWSIPERHLRRPCG